jgi:predicted transcriptional regulator
MSVTIDPTLLGRLDWFADICDRSRSWLVQSAIAEFLARRAGADNDGTPGAAFYSEVQSRGGTGSLHQPVAAGSAVDPVGGRCATVADGVPSNGEVQTMNNQPSMRLDQIAARQAERERERAADAVANQERVARQTAAALAALASGVKP